MRNRSSLNRIDLIIAKMNKLVLQLSEETLCIYFPLKAPWVI